MGTFVQTFVMKIRDKKMPLSPSRSCNRAHIHVHNDKYHWTHTCTQTQSIHTCTCGPLKDTTCTCTRYPHMCQTSIRYPSFVQVIRYNRLLGTIQSTLNDLLKALKGLVVMSQELETMFNSLYNNSVPTLWAAKVCLSGSGLWVCNQREYRIYI